MDPPLYPKIHPKTSNESGASKLPDTYMTTIVRFIQVLQIIIFLIAELLILIYLLILCCGNISIYNNNFCFETCMSNLKLINIQSIVILQNILIIFL